MIKRYFIKILLTFFIATITSCSFMKPSNVKDIDRKLNQEVKYEDELIRKSYMAADILGSKLKMSSTSHDKTIIVTTFSNNDDIEKTNSLGRLVPYLIASRLAHLGYRPVELRIREKDIAIKKGVGEIILSRDYKKLKKDIKGTFVLTGHYTILNKKVYIHSEIISLVDQTIVASYDFVTSSGEVIPSVFTNSELLEYKL